MNLRAVCLTVGVVAYAVGVSICAQVVTLLWSEPVPVILAIGGFESASILGPALWLALAGCAFPIRLVVQLGWFAAWLAANILWEIANRSGGAVNWTSQWNFIAAIWLIAALLAPFRYWAGAIRREPLDPQLKLKGLFGLTLAIAIALTLVRSGRPLVLEWAMVPAGVCTIIAVVLLTVGTSPKQKAIAVCLMVIGALPWAYSQRYLQWSLAVPAVEALLLALPLLVCRRLGYRLQR